MFEVMTCSIILQQVQVREMGRQFSVLTFRPFV